MTKSPKMTQKRNRVIEKKIQTTTEDFIALFSKNEYAQIKGRKYTHYSKNDVTVSEEILKSNIAMVVEFNKLMQDGYYIPTQCHYVLSTLTTLLESAIEEGYQITEAIETYLFNRYKKSYMGFIAEEYAIRLFIENFKNILILTNEQGDLYEGVDFLIVDLETEMVYRVHITSIEDGKKKLDDKERRGRDRKFSVDVYLLYDPRNENETSFILNKYPNNFPFFKRSYIEDSFNVWKNNINEWHPDEDVGYTLDSLELKKRCTRYGGIWEMYRANHIDPSYEATINKVKTMLNS